MPDPVDAITEAAQACARALTAQAGQLRDLMPMLLRAQEALQPQYYTCDRADPDRAALESAITGTFARMVNIENAAGDVIRASSAWHLLRPPWIAAATVPLSPSLAPPISPESMVGPL
jgi:hypothetical protein